MRFGFLCVLPLCWISVCTSHHAVYSHTFTHLVTYSVSLRFLSDRLPLIPSDHTTHSPPLVHLTLVRSWMHSLVFFAFFVLYGSVITRISFRTSFSSWLLGSVVFAHSFCVAFSRVLDHNALSGSPLCVSPHLSISWMDRARVFFCGLSPRIATDKWSFVFSRSRLSLWIFALVCARIAGSSFFFIRFISSFSDRITQITPRITVCWITRVLRSFAPRGLQDRFACALVLRLRVNGWIWIISRIWIKRGSSLDHVFSRAGCALSFSFHCTFCAHLDAFLVTHGRSSLSLDPLCTRSVHSLVFLFCHFHVFSMDHLSRLRIAPSHGSQFYGSLWTHALTLVASGSRILSFAFWIARSGSRLRSRSLALMSARLTVLRSLHSRFIMPDLRICCLAWILFGLHIFRFRRVPGSFSFLDLSRTRFALSFAFWLHSFTRLRFAAHALRTPARIVLSAGLRAHSPRVAWFCTPLLHHVCAHLTPTHTSFVRGSLPFSRADRAHSFWLHAVCLWISFTGSGSLTRDLGSLTHLCTYSRFALFCARSGSLLSLDRSLWSCASDGSFVLRSRSAGSSHLCTRWFTHTSRSLHALHTAFRFAFTCGSRIYTFTGSSLHGSRGSHVLPLSHTHVSFSFTRACVRVSHGSFCVFFAHGGSSGFQFFSVHVSFALRSFCTHVFSPGSRFGSLFSFWITAGSFCGLLVRRMHTLRSAFSLHTRSLSLDSWLVI